VQSRARRHGNGGIYGSRGNVASATYRFHEILSGSNPTLSAIEFALSFQPFQRRVISLSNFSAHHLANRFWLHFTIGVGLPLEDLFEQLDSAQFAQAIGRSSWNLRAITSQAG
jgi:hypothetical protein